LQTLPKKSVECIFFKPAFTRPEKPFCQEVRAEKQTRTAFLNEKKHCAAKLVQK